MSTIGKILWVLESRLQEQVTLDDLVAVTGRSKSYLSRVFPLVTGYSISGYLRARRLTEAARLLAGGATDILSVALDAGYGSHEAFTRAFRDQFGQTPDQVRRGRSLDRLKLLEPQRMDTTTAPITIAAPRFENRPTLHFAGIRQEHEMANPAGIPHQWQRFHPYIGNVDGAIAGAAYGIVGHAGPDAKTFDYIVAVEVRAGVEVPPELATVTVPPMRWARFGHPADTTSIRATIGAAHDWLADNGYRASSEAFAFIEYYGPRFDPATGSGDIEVWFGLEG